MHPMIGKEWQAKIDGVLRTYKIVSIDNEGWVKMERDNGKGHCYMHEDIHRHFLAKIGYQRRQS